MKRICIKYGGNAMLDESLQRQVIRSLIRIKEEGNQIVLVHGGGPFIARQLEQAGIESEFVDGHRKTTPEAMLHVEMALKGQVNGQLVTLFNLEDSLALGLSGKDAQVVKVKPRMHEMIDAQGKAKKVSLGQVGDVVDVNDQFLLSLLEQGITPVIACIGTGEDGQDYNVNADMVAGHVAGALKSDLLIMLTDIDGLRKEVSDPKTLIRRLTVDEAKSLFGNSIQGGMIPKVEACIEAIRAGAEEAIILNGTQPRQLLDKLIHHQDVGTTIVA